ncbi:MAG: enoyl-CoA hydratase-related protein [Bdellovibrionales bacterium]
MNFLEIKEQGSVVYANLNRPDVHNAFNPKMIQEITAFFQSFKKNKSARVVVFSGNGKSFCAGADLEWMKEMVKFSKKQNLADSKKLYDMFESLRNCALPVITQAHGSVMGGGLGLVAASDIVAVQVETKFCFSEVRLGLVPSVISSFVLEKAHAHLAREMMLTAELFQAPKAEKMGLVHFYGSEVEVEAYVQGRIDLMLANGPEAVKATKKLLNFNARQPQTKIVKETIRVIAERRMSDEGQEGMKSFLEKRSASWKSSK